MAVSLLVRVLISFHPGSMSLIVIIDFGMMLLFPRHFSYMISINTVNSEAACKTVQILIRGLL